MSARHWWTRNPIHLIAARSLATERYAIENPRAFHRMSYLYIIKLVCVVTLFAMLLPPPGSINIVHRACIILLIVPVSWLAAGAARRAAEAYFDGYIRGQADTISSFNEAARRGIPINDWAKGELERQLVHLTQRMDPDVARKRPS